MIIKRIKNTDKGHAQFIIATHSPILLAYENARIFSFDYNSVQPIGYKETDHYKLYKIILSDQ